MLGNSGSPSGRFGKFSKLMFLLMASVTLSSVMTGVEQTSVVELSALGHDWNHSAASDVT